MAKLGLSGPRHSTREGRIACFWSRESSVAHLGPIFCHLGDWFLLENRVSFIKNSFKHIMEDLSQMSHRALVRPLERQQTLPSSIGEVRRARHES